jgi:hypothetical protein
MRLVPLLAFLIAALPIGLAQDVANLKHLAISKVKPLPAVQAAADRAGKRLSMDRMTEALDSQLIAAFTRLRRFEVVGRSDADALVEEAAATKQTFSFGDADYLVVVTVDDFQDAMRATRFESLGTTELTRDVRFAAVAKVYAPKAKNAVRYTANFQESTKDSQEKLGVRDGDTSDAMLLALTRSMAEKIVYEVTRVAYPAPPPVVLAKTNKTVSINLGETSGVAVGQVWEAFKLGEEMIDPNTNRSLGREEVYAGKVRVVRVNPQFTQAEIIEGTAVEKGALLRLANVKLQ